MTLVNLQLKAIIYECIGIEHVNLIEQSLAFQEACDFSQEDAISFSKKDPSASSNLELIVKTYTSYSAVLHYRLANRLYYGESNIPPELIDIYCGLIMQRGKLRSGAEIHYKAKIGRRFILDHGFGTVIGET